MAKPTSKSAANSLPPAESPEVPDGVPKVLSRRIPPVPSGYVCAPPPPPVPEYLRLSPPIMLGRPEGWVCRRCTEWWNWHPYKPPTEQELDSPCAECRKTMDAEERAVEVNRLLLARLSAGSGPMALPIPTALTDHQPQPHPASTQSTPEFACTVKEAGAMLGCGTTKVYELLNKGRLQAAEKFGRKRMVLKSSLEALLKAGGIAAPPPRPRKPASNKPGAKDAKSLAAAISKLPVK